MKVEVKETNNYSLFKSITSNREVNMAHVRKLAKAIQKNNMLHLNPIIVDNNMNVIDGQHRLEAAKLLEISLFYVIDNEVSKDDIASLNSNKLNWRTIDYVNYWTVEKRAGFDVISSFISRNPLLPISTCIQLLNEFNERSTEDIMNGHCNVNGLEKAEETVKILNFISEYFKHAYSGKFVAAIRAMVRHDLFDFENFKMKVEEQPRSLVSCVTTKQYLQMLSEIYNYKLSKNRIDFR